MADPSELTIDPGDGNALSLPHGFAGVPYDFSSRGLPDHAVPLCRLLRRGRLVLMRQEHDSHVHEIEELPGVGVTLIEHCDGVVCDRRLRGVVLGVRTADCVPILIEGAKTICAVHAGWRGIASGVVERAAEVLRRREGLSRCRALIGPCAGGATYEVGAEVVSAIGRRAVCSEAGGRLLLDLEATAKRILEATGVACAAMGINTMTNASYHSYRREGPGGGHNLSFICSEMP